MASGAATPEGFAARRRCPPLWSGSPGERQRAKTEGFATRRRAPTMTRGPNDATQCRAAIPRRDERRRGQGPPPCGLGAASAVSSGATCWASLTGRHFLKPHAKLSLLPRSRTKLCCPLLFNASYQAAAGELAFASVPLGPVSVSSVYQVLRVP